MTEEEAIKKLREVSPGDREAAHGIADDVLLEFLDSHHPSVSAAWRELELRCNGFWYA